MKRFIDDLTESGMTHRKAVQDVLRQKFSSTKAKQYEKEIYQMCEALAGEVFDESIADVYSYYAYEKLGQLMTCSETVLSEILQDIKSQRVGEDSFYRRKMIKKETEAEEPMIRSGVFPCITRGCRSRHTKETVFRLEQRRSADEGMTAVVSCRICKKEYTL